MVKRGDVIQRVIWCGPQVSITNYAIVTYIHENGSVDIIASSLNGYIYGGLWDRGTFVPTGRKYDLTEMETVLSGCAV